MTGEKMDERFHEDGSYTLGDRWHLAADTDRIAFSHNKGEIELFDADGHETVIVDGPLADFELERYLISLSGDTISAVTEAEVELWSQTIPGATDIVGLGKKDVLAVMTVDGEIIGLDLETGRQLFETQRPHPDLTDVDLAGGNGYLCIAAWSFILCFDASGELVFERNLDSAVEDVSFLDEQVVAVLKGGLIASFEAQTGEQQWSESVAVRSLSPVGNQSLLALTDTDGVLIHPDGRITELGIGTGSQIVAAQDKSVLGITSETSVQICRRGPSKSTNLEANILTDSVTGQSTIRANIRNTGENTLNVPVLLETPDSVPLISDQNEITLTAGESQEIAYRIKDTPPIDSFECQLTVDGTALAKKDLIVEEDPDITEILTVNTTWTAITGETATASHTLENTSKSKIEELALNNELIDLIPAGEEVTLDREYPLDGNERTIVINSEKSQSEARLQKQIQPPESAISAKISVDKSEPLSIDIEVESIVEAAVNGELTVQIEPGQTVRREISLSKGERLQLVILPITGGAIHSVQVTSPLLTAPVREDIDMNDRQLPAGKSDQPELNIERQVPEAVSRGERFVEKVRVTNQSDNQLKDLTLASLDDERQIGSLEPGEKIILQREHACYEAGEAKLDTLTVGDTSSGPETVQVRESPLTVRATATCDAEQIDNRFQIENNSDQTYLLKRVGIDIDPDDAREIWELNPPLALHPGATECIERTLSTEGVDLDREFGNAVVIYHQEKHNGEKLNNHLTLVPLQELQTEEITIDLLGRSRFVSDMQCVAEVAITNETDQTFTDVEVTVDGEPVLDSALSQNSTVIPEFKPSDQETLLVDVRSSSHTESTVSVTIDGQTADDSITVQREFTGPVAESPEEWTQNEYLKQWQETGMEQPSTMMVESHLVTPFQPTEAGNHR